MQWTPELGMTKMSWIAWLARPCLGFFHFELWRHLPISFWTHSLISQAILIFLSIKNKNKQKTKTKVTLYFHSFPSWPLECVCNMPMTRLLLHLIAILAHLMKNHIISVSTFAIEKSQTPTFGKMTIKNT